MSTRTEIKFVKSKVMAHHTASPQPLAEAKPTLTEMAD